ncbi:Glycosyl hydrolases family 2, sugar binding domain [Chitinophaga sp. YR573]|uniref:glycosyl hydrolase n=1 Tax=Chitinophaga sp. YR573 TaxID=1881040 RepID=UPI0008D57A72|nr:glycosyl hydrolase [Chitinophaga sp. YR573]SEW14888.1 Glycosyl hydrolases family 2, sugar binding domain [Chitinophaga sp. YR573]
MKNICRVLFFIASVALLDSCSYHVAGIEKGFKLPPDTIQTSIYWYWLSDNISKEGVIKDLQAMKKVGINRAFIGNIGLDPNNPPYGKVKLFSDEWWDIMHTTLKTAGELGIEIGIFNGPGWSQSGGPWVKPEQAMRYLISSQVTVLGGKEVMLKLEKPISQFQDVRVITFKTPQLKTYSPKLSSTPLLADLDVLINADTIRAINFDSKGQQQIDIDFPAEYTAQSLTIYPTLHSMVSNVTLQIKEDTGYKTIKQFDINRGNDALNVGFSPYAPVAVSFHETKATSFRLLFDHYSDGSGITELVLSPLPRVEKYAEKTLAKMFQSPLPYWQEYQWPVQEKVMDAGTLINPKEVLDISAFMQADGTLKWNAPEGNWVIMRTGMTPTKVTNSPASPEGRGLEIDKMSKEHIASHFDSFMGEIIRRVPAADRKSWKVVVQDSYETGGQNWTDALIDSFKSTYHYDPLPYLPVFKGNVVGSQDQSDRFLWDVRRFIADKVAYNYVGGLREVCHQHGLTTWLENYGHWGFPGEFLQYGGQSDEVGGEFWSEGDLGNIENRAASSSAHIYGKVKVSAESETAALEPFGRYPANMKQRTDRFFTEGINNTLLHVYIQQPDDRKPGVSAWFGNEFNRNNTWFYDMDLFTAYLKRCNFMLQQGKYVADIAYFIGEDAPKMTGVQDPALPKGFSFDYINAEVIENRLSVKNGRFVLPDGMNYKVLVLPKLETMRPELLEKIAALVEQGGVVLGPKPIRTPGLQNYPEADNKLNTLAAILWGNIDTKMIKTHSYGKGMVMDGMSLEEVFSALKMRPDFNLPKDEEALFIHRKIDNGDIYFLSNQKAEKISIHPAFRIQDELPELWDATTGTMRPLPQFTNDGETIQVPIELEAYESAFILFRKTKAEKKSLLNYPLLISSDEITTPWTVNFDTLTGGPAAPVTFNKLTDWSQNSDSRIKYYSGTAVYHNTFSLARLTKGEHIRLNTGKVIAIAKVKVNGKYVGGLWTPPYSLDITDAIKEGKNEIEISVVNTWVNRLIGDSFLPEDKRKTWSIMKDYDQKSKLVPAGLLGPVMIERNK